MTCKEKESLSFPANATIDQPWKVRSSIFRMRGHCLRFFSVLLSIAADALLSPRLALYSERKFSDFSHAQGRS